MAASSRGSWIYVPRPKTFLGLISLQTGTELIALSLVVNKATGAYGLLAIFTAYALSPVQLSLYLSSVFVLAALAFLIPHIRRHTPFHVLALAWLYVVDTVLNAAYVAAFAALWFAAPFHDPEGNAGKEAGPTEGVPDGSDLDGAQQKQVNEGTGGQETAVSMVLVVLFTVAIRIYFSLVVAAFARSVVVVAADAEEEGKGMEDGNPFAVGRVGGEGWKGWLGRKMVAVGRGFWLGGKEDEEWVRESGRKFGGAAE
ncbi:Inositolphosphorylceramide synthase subunit Kei1-domain-containing protein [Coniochaeta sp. 2T2.1]|nr:Inositolphosphorylceramide synthase subunit Kei1-domain-containing protein [Coniochaeta sp. 2T2.1]